MSLSKRCKEVTKGHEIHLKDGSRINFNRCVYPSYWGYYVDTRYLFVLHCPSSINPLNIVTNACHSFYARWPIQVAIRCNRNRPELNAIVQSSTTSHCVVRVFMLCYIDCRGWLVCCCNLHSISLDSISAIKNTLISRWSMRLLPENVSLYWILVWIRPKILILGSISYLNQASC